MVVMAISVAILVAIGIVIGIASYIFFQFCTIFLSSRFIEYISQFWSFFFGCSSSNSSGGNIYVVLFLYIFIYILLLLFFSFCFIVSPKKTIASETIASFNK